MWKKGTLTVQLKGKKPVEITYCMKHFEEPSIFGIDEGRISKLMFRQNGREVYNYDRGLDIKPQTPEAETALNLLKEKYN